MISHCQGGRRCVVVDCPTLREPWPPKQPIFPARVRWLDLDSGLPAPSSAIALAEALPELVREWLELVRTPRFTAAGLESYEKERGQLDRVLADLGPQPPPEEAEALAFWVTGLVNPLPGLKMAAETELKLEVRPAVLMARSPLERVRAAHEGITRAIETLK